MAHGFSAEQMETLFTLGTSRSDFLARVSEGVLAAVAKYTGQRDMVEPDLLAAAAALEPSTVTKSEWHAVDVETSGPLTRGMTTVDWFHRTGKAPNVEIVTEMDTARVWEMLRSALA